jgi:hypothetical protein
MCKQCMGGYDLTLIQGSIQLRDKVAHAATRFCTVGAQDLCVFSMALVSPLAPKIFNRLKNFWEIWVHL